MYCMCKLEGLRGSLKVNKKSRCMSRWHCDLQQIVGVGTHQTVYSLSSLSLQTCTFPIVSDTESAGKVATIIAACMITMVSRVTLNADLMVKLLCVRNAC